MGPSDEGLFGRGNLCVAVEPETHGLVEARVRRIDHAQGTKDTKKTHLSVDKAEKDIHLVGWILLDDSIMRRLGRDYHCHVAFSLLQLSALVVVELLLIVVSTTRRSRSNN